MTRPGSPQNAPPRRTGCLNGPPPRAVDRCAPSTGSPGRTQTDKAPVRAVPQSASALDQYFLTGPRGALSENLLPLLRPHAELAEAVHRHVQAQKVLQNGGEQINSAAYELFLVELH